MTDTADGPTGARPCLLWHAQADSAVAGEIGVLLSGLGFTPLHDLSHAAAAAIVCVLSPAAVAAGLSDVAAAARGRRLVVVCTAPIEGMPVPPEIAEPHWLLWWRFSQAERSGLLATALTTSIDDRRAERTLLSDARIWVESGRLPDLLAEPRSARRMADELADRSQQGHPYPPEAVEFVAASAHKARALRRLAARRWAIRILAVGAIAILVFTGAQSIRDRARVNRLATSLAVVPTDVDRPHHSAARTIGALVEIDAYDGPSSAAMQAAATRALAQRWPRLSLGHSWSTSAVVSLDPHPPEGLVIAGEGRGNIAAFSTSDGEVRWRIAVSDGRIDRVASSEDGTRVVTIDSEHNMAVVDTASSTPVRTVPVDRSTGLAVSTDGRRALLLGDTPHEVDLDSLTSTPLHHPATVLAGVGSTHSDRSWTVVVRLGESVELRDLLGGRVLAAARLPVSDLETAAVSPGGTRAVVAGGGRLVELTDSGSAAVVHSVPDVVGSLSVTDRGDIAVSSRAAGNQTILADDRVVDRICTISAGSTDALAWTPDGDLACLHTFGIQVERPDRPVAPPGPERYFSDTAESTSVRGLDIGSRPTVTSSSPREGDEAVGTEGGQVVLFGPTAEGTVVETGRWSSPDRRAITALSWSADGEDLLARTHERWWRVRLCPGCSHDLASLVGHARSRFTACFDPAMERLFARQTVETLGIRTCQDGPAPER